MLEGATGEALDIAVFLEFSVPMHFPVWPSFVDVRAASPLFPCIGEIATLNGVFGASGDHGLFGDGYRCIGSKVLTVFLLSCVDGERKRWVDAFHERLHVFCGFHPGQCGNSGLGCGQGVHRGESHSGLHWDRQAWHRRLYQSLLQLG